MITRLCGRSRFYTFERAIHTERNESELTAERIGAIWCEVQAESLGPAVELKPGYERSGPISPFRPRAVLRLR